MSETESEKNAAQETSHLGDYLIREERAHGRTSREIFKAQDLRDSLIKKSSETVVLKGKDDKQIGQAKFRYEANNLFSVSDVRAFDGRFAGDALYAPGGKEAWNWKEFPPPQWPRASLLGSLVERLKRGPRRESTTEEKSEVQAMVERAMGDYLARDETKRLIAEIDRVQARVDQEWAKEQAMYIAKFESGDDDRHHE